MCTDEVCSLDEVCNRLQMKCVVQMKYANSDCVVALAPDLRLMPDPACGGSAGFRDGWS